MTSNQISVRTFVGCRLTSEVRMHLNQSTLWKQISVLPSRDKDELIEVHHQGKDYLGIYLNTETSPLTIAEITCIENLIACHLHSFCPNFDILTLQPAIFTQVFVA